MDIGDGSTNPGERSRCCDKDDVPLCRPHAVTP